MESEKEEKIQISQELIDGCLKIIARIDDKRVQTVLGHSEFGIFIVNHDDYKKHSKGNGRFISELSKMLGKSTGYIRQSIKFAEIYPDIELFVREYNLYNDEDISWTFIRENLLYEENNEEKIFKKNMKVVNRKGKYTIELEYKGYNMARKLYSKLLKLNFKLPASVEGFIIDCTWKGIEKWKEELEKK